MKAIRTIEWKHGAIRIIDQTLLPLKFRVLDIRDIRVLWKAIRQLKVRGAPALGAAAAWGVYLGVKDAPETEFAGFSRRLDKVIGYLASARPTARNLFWGLERMGSVAVRNRQRPVSRIKKLLFRQARQIVEDDRQTCRAIGAFGSTLIHGGDTILTVCNAGILATIDYGTALGVLYSAQARGRKFKVYACETRPLLQGARLTTWELTKRKIDVTLICDNMAATLMAQGKIDAVITGADRIAANGDAANKIGTYSLAVLARHHRIPFYIAAPFSTFDLQLKDGAQIPIEERPAGEVTTLYFKNPVAAQGVKVYNPAFDVTDHRLITALITEKGIIRPPFKAGIKKMTRR
ncbi:MAG TPA: S-methyl-5-thioribose-1-phosphate isomerase [Candidatus Omnitrophota bacterium]|nr:S-methyl-5-thioribose-1-phosphate isomerase [Candidatus Omnitrophota bacterium]